MSSAADWYVGMGACAYLGEVKLQLSLSLRRGCFVAQTRMVLGHKLERFQVTEQC